MKTAQKNQHILQTAGWLGVACILTAYISVTLGFLSPQTLPYNLLNVLGSAGILVSSYNKRDFQPILLNIVWIIVAATGIIVNL